MIKSDPFGEYTVSETSGGRKLNPVNLVLPGQWTLN